MEAPTPVWQRGSLGALPLILTDTSALIDLAKIEIVQDSNRLGSEATRANIARAVFDNLVGEGGRTMVLSRRNFIELFQVISGSLDLMKESDGTLAIPDGPSPGEFRFPDAQIIYNIMQEYKAHGKLRCYENKDDFLREEVGPPKGGIVIVDVNGRGEYPDHGRLMNYAAVPDAVLDANSDVTRAAQKPDAGDDRLIALGHAVHMYAQSEGFNQKYMVLNNDGGLRKRFEHLAENMVGYERSKQPTQARALDMVAALYKGSQEGIPGCDITGEELANFARATVIERESKHRTPPGMARVQREAEYVKDWLDLTAPDRVNEGWVGRTSEQPQARVVG